MIKKYKTNLLMFILFISETDILSEATEKAYYTIFSNIDQNSRLIKSWRPLSAYTKKVCPYTANSK